MANDYDTIKQALLDALKDNPDALLASGISINGKSYSFRSLQEVLDAIEALENKMQRTFRRPIHGRANF